jgi:hypothetical protein
MPIFVYDIAQPRPEPYPTLHAAMVVLLARYPAAVFSDVDFDHDPVIWVWPSNTASMHARPEGAVAWLRQEPPLDDPRPGQALDTPRAAG